MQELFGLFAVLAGLAAILANIALWSPRKLWVKWSALATTAVLLPAGYMALAEMLSRPKPIEIEWANKTLADAAVLASRMDEGQAIYLWLGIEGVEEPRAYKLPWSEEVARQLHGSQREAKQTGAELRIRSPFESSLEDRAPRFYASPPPPPPLKQAPSQNPLNFQRSNSGTVGALN